MMRAILLLALRTLMRNRMHSLFLLLAIALASILTDINTASLQHEGAKTERIGTFSFGFGFSRSSRKTQEEPLLAQVWSLTGTILLASAWMIFTLLNLDISRRTKELSRLRAIGFTHLQIALLTLTQGCILGVTGGLLGLLAGFLWAGHHLPTKETLLFTLGFSLLSALLASLLPALRAAKTPSILPDRTPLRRICPCTYLWLTLAGCVSLLPLPLILHWPGLALSTRLSLLSSLGSCAFFAGLFLLIPAFLRFMELLLAPLLAFCLRIPSQLFHLSLTSNLPRSIITTTAISIGFALFTAIRIWADSMLQMFRLPDNIPSHFLRFQEDVASPELAVKVAALPLKDCIPITLAQPEFASPQREQLLASGAMATNAVLLGTDTLPNLPLKTDSHPQIHALFQQNAPVCIIPETLAKQCRLTVGDAVALYRETKRHHPKSPASFSDEQAIRLTIVGITAFPWAWFSKCTGIRVSAPRTAALLFVPYALPIRAFGGTPHEAFWLTPAQHITEEFLQKQIKSIAESAAENTTHISPSYSGGTRWDSGLNRNHYLLTSRNSINDSLNSRSGKVITLMLKLPRAICILSSLLLFCVAGTSIATRQRELRILRVCGLTPAGMRHLLMGEMLLLTVTAVILAFLAGLLFASVCCKLADSATLFGVTAPPILIPWEKLLPCYLIAIMAALLGGYTGSKG